MSALSNNPSQREILMWLRGLTRSQLQAVGVWIHQNSDYDINPYVNKDLLLKQFSAIDSDLLLEGIENFFDPFEEDENNEADDDEDSDEDGIAIFTKPPRKRA